MSEDDLPNVHYGPPNQSLDWRKEKLHNDKDDDEFRHAPKSTCLLLRGNDPGKLFPPHTEDTPPNSLLSSADLGWKQRSRAFKLK